MGAGYLPSIVRSIRLLSVIATNAGTVGSIVTPIAVSAEAELSTPREGGGETQRCMRLGGRAGIGSAVAVAAATAGARAGEEGGEGGGVVAGEGVGEGEEEEREEVMRQSI